MKTLEDIKRDGWESGINQVWLGDCLDFMKLLPDKCVDLVVTSPPYNKGTENRRHSPTDSWTKANIKYDSVSDSLPEVEYQKWQKKILREAVRIIKPTGSIFYNHKYRIQNHAIVSPELWIKNFIVRQVIIWNRGSSPSLEPIRFMPTIEQI